MPKMCVHTGSGDRWPFNVDLARHPDIIIVDEPDPQFSAAKSEPPPPPVPAAVQGAKKKKTGSGSGVSAPTLTVNEPELDLSDIDDGSE